MKTTVDGGEGGERTPFIPSEDWIKQFDDQSSAPEFVESTKRYARMRANLVAHAGRKVDDYYARELVQDVLDDTLEGVLTWDPARVDLTKHVLDAIRSRTRHDYRQARRHVSFDPDGARSATMLAVESSLAAEHDTGRETAELAAIAERVLAAIRTLATSDPDVLLLIEAYAQGATKKVDVQHITQLSSSRYDAARKRMRRFVRHLPNELRDAANPRA